MKILKTIIITLLVAFAGLLAYANFRYRSPAEELSKVALASFKLDADLSPPERTALEKSITSTPGISACSIGENGNIASVIFFPEKINIATLTELLTAHGKIGVSQKKLVATGSGCPVHQVNASFDRIMSALDFRNL